MSENFSVSNKLPAKQVSILAHRKRRINKEKSEQHVRHLHRKNALHKKKRDFTKPEAFIMKFRMTERDEMRIKRSLKTTGLYVKAPTDRKLAIVMRHRGRKIASQKINDVLSSFGLRKLHDTVFIKVNDANLSLLKIINPYIVWGYPDISTIRDLIFKKGFIKINNKKTPIQSNQIVEENMGENGIICVEDIVHEICTVGSNFDFVTKQLGVFKLGAPREGWKKKMGISFDKGGEYGNRKDNISALIKLCM